ncbi:MAG: F0F1 ATP synthase subunit delta [Acutalibacter sp.]
MARIEEVLKRRHGLSKVEFQVKLEPELLGGFVIHLQGTTYDKSVRGMLRGLRRSLKERE